MIALLMQQNTEVCARLHQNRKADFRQGKRLGKYDHLIEWTKPRQCPDWMDRKTFQQMPETIRLREIHYHVVEKGKRTKVVTVVTTLVDEAHTKEEIAELYGFRWNIELDIRSIKDSLHLGHTRCQVVQQTASANQLRRHLPICFVLMDADRLRTTEPQNDSQIKRHSPGSNRLLRSRQPAWSPGTQSPQKTQARLPADESVQATTKRQTTQQQHQIELTTRQYHSVLAPISMCPLSLSSQKDG
ncbi:MAG: transposase [Planctomycetaceae bacterium]|nr:transposase [Planctomycetaceae bacterium]